MGGIELPNLAQLTAMQVFALAVIGLLVALLVISTGISLWLYFTERELRQTFPNEYTGKTNYEAREPRMPDPLKAAPRIALGTLLGLVLAGLGVASTFLTDQFFPVAASLEALRIDSLFDAMFAISVFFFLLVEGLLIIAMIRFRAKKDDLSDAKPIHGNATLEIVWTLIPTVIVTWLAITSVNVLQAVQDERPTAFTVVVQGFQFGWQYEYPHMEYTAVDALYLPAGTPIRLVLRSNDVIHSFWVPAFRLKRDLMPNINTEMYVTPLEPGEYPVYCAELCGSGHSAMLSTVVVMEYADFKAWEAENDNTQREPLTPYEQGWALFISNGCTACHVLDDVGSVGIVGPALNGVATRAETRVDGQTAEEYIRNSILNPLDYIVVQDNGEPYPPAMPQTYGDTISEADLTLLVNYLLEQK